jgi:hypothetical protein
MVLRKVRTTVLTQIDFDGELKLVDKDEVHEDERLSEQENPHRRWAKFLPQDQGTKYTGPERRRGERRKTGDRRGLVRFEEKSDRRSGKDRRKGSWDIKCTI